MQGANRLDGYCSSVTSTPPPHTHTHNHLLLPEPLSALFLRSSSTLSPSSPFFLVSSSRSLLLPSHLFSVSLLRGCIWLHRSVWHAGGSWGLARLKGSAPRGRRRALTDKHHLCQTQSSYRNHNASTTYPKVQVWPHTSPNLSFTSTLSASKVGVLTSAYFERRVLICFQVLNAIRTDQRICLKNCIKYGLAFSWLRGERGDCWETMTKMKIIEVEKNQGKRAWEM